MNKLIFLLSIFFTTNTLAQLSNIEIKDLKLGRVKKDTSYVYWLPYKKKVRHLFVQGANSNMSHKNELSFDFKMKKGSIICAARNGVVIATKADSDKGGLKNEFLSEGNHIIIQHDDGSTALYWHLKQNGVLVQLGDTVSKGQSIGKSGNTGYTAFPHLHFQIIDKNGKEILPRFYTKKGIIYLRPARWYKAVHN
jgi:murein DD-endopeptidase MepM/ murein hydrolase activator NlpD